MTEENKQTTDELRDLKITSRIEVLETDLENIKEMVKEIKETISSCIESIYRIQTLRVELENLNDRIGKMEETQKTSFEILDTLRNSTINNSLSIKEMEGLFIKLETIESGLVEELTSIKEDFSKIKEVQKKEPRPTFWKEVSSKTLVSVLTTVAIIVLIFLLIVLSDKAAEFFKFLADQLKSKL